MCRDAQILPIQWPAWSPDSAFGEVLARFAPLSRHDIFEILEEQRLSRRKFGQIALARGLCVPEQVWQAWSTQLVGRTPTVDLEKLGVDAQAVSSLSAEVAASLGVVPIRSMSDRVIVAASHSGLARATDELTRHLHLPFSLVAADRRQISKAILRYYPQARNRQSLALVQAALPRESCDRLNCKGICSAARPLAKAG